MSFLDKNVLKLHQQKGIQLLEKTCWLMVNLFYINIIIYILFTVNNTLTILLNNVIAVCNVTLDARMLMSKSGKSYGQIKSPAMAGPMFCYYRLIPQATQRVEIQLYRLISVGRFNGTR